MDIFDSTEFPELKSPPEEPSKLAGVPDISLPGARLSAPKKILRGIVEFAWGVFFSMLLVVVALIVAGLSTWIRSRR
jgi:hypothetical protein